MMSAQIQVTVDGSPRSVSVDSKPTLIFEEIYPDRVKPGPDCIVVCKINGVPRDLWTDLVDGDVIESVSIRSEEGLMVLRHSTAHVLAQAVQETFPQTRLGIGPPIKDGFYYDFDPEKAFTPDDLTRLESVMKKIVKDGQRFKPAETIRTECRALTSNSRRKWHRTLNSQRLIKQENLNFRGSAYVIRSRKPGKGSNSASGERSRSISRANSCYPLRSQMPLSSLGSKERSPVFLNNLPRLGFDGY